MDPLSSAPLEALENYGFRRFNRPHLEPADCSEQVQHSGHSKVGGGAPGYALEVRKCIRADERTAIAEHIHRARNTAASLPCYIGAEHPARADRHVRAEHG